MKTAIIIFPGSNCDNEMERFLYNYTGIKPIRVWHKETQLPDVDLYVLPGGFSYGDYLRAGVLASFSRVMKELKKTDRKILGICNGFQILCEAGMLPGTLRINKTQEFICLLKISQIFVVAQQITQIHFFTREFIPNIC